MSGAAYAKFLKEREIKDQETPELKAQRIVANLLSLHVAKRQTVGLSAALDDEDKARLKLALTILKGPHGDSVRYLFQQAFPEWKGAQPAAVRICEHCGEPDPTDSHYDAWSDHGDGVGSDGWNCSRPGETEAPVGD